VIDRLLVLGYHNVADTPAFPLGGQEGIDGFRAQVRFLARAARPYTVGDALDRLARGAPLGPRAVALTFDDGYADNVTLAAEVLAHHGVPATFFCVPEFLDGAARPWWERLAWACLAARRSEVTVEGERIPLGDEAQRRAARRRISAHLLPLRHDERLRRLEALVAELDPAGEDPSARLMTDWDGARRLAATGFEIGSHSLRHARLANEPADVQAADLAAARRRLQEGTGRPVPVLAYPHGTAADFDDHSRAAAAAAGHTHAVTTISGWVDRRGARDRRFDVPRIMVSPSDGVPALARAVASAGRARLRHLRARVGARTGPGASTP